MMFAVVVAAVGLLLTPSLALPDHQDLMCSVGCMKTHASSLADIATALGFNTSATGKASVAMGVNSRAISDATVPGGSSCGGCIAMGLDSTAMGDWSTAMNAETLSRGYASLAVGFETKALSFGEVTLGLFTETGDYSEEMQANMSVIPAFNENDAVLRVGIGCPKDKVLPAGGFGCKTAGPLDALRVYKSGALYLKKPNGKIVPDVQAAIEKSQADHEETKQELTSVKQQLKETRDELAEMKKMLADVMGRFAEIQKTV